MSRYRMVMVSLAFVLMLPSKCAAQHGGAGMAGNTVSLTGMVSSADGNRPVNQATIRLCDSGGNQVEETITNDSGQFSFRRIQRGTYILAVNAMGFQSQDVHVDLSFTSDRGVSIILKPEPNQSPAVARASTISAHEMSIPEKARDLMSSGQKKLYQNKDAQGGLEDFQQAVSVAPGYYEAYYQMAMAYVSLGKNDDAGQSFRKSIEVSGDKYGEADIGLGALMLNGGDVSQGEKTIRRGLELNPKFWLGHYELGRALLDENKISDAQKSAERAVALAPNAPLVYRLLANVHLKEKDYPALLHDLDAYIKLDPDSPAGVRAKELRTQVSQKIGNESTGKGSPRVP